MHRSFRSFVLLCTLSLLTAALQGETRVSEQSSYTIVTDTLDAGGQRTASADYVQDGGIEGIVGTATTLTAAPTLETNKSGYVAQLFDVLKLTVTAPSDPAIVLGGRTVQLTATAGLDDGTALVLPGTLVVWTAMGAGLAGVDSAGVATADGVAGRADVSVRAEYAGFAPSLALRVVPSTLVLDSAVAAMQQTAPNALGGTGALVINLLDQGHAFAVAGPHPRWRLAGAPDWHASGDVIEGLTAGLYLVEFETLVYPGNPAVIRPAPRTMVVGVAAGPVPTVPPAVNYEAAPSGRGTLSVSVLLDGTSGIGGVLAQEQAQSWRVVGETGWRDGGTKLDLPVGGYLIEFKVVPGPSYQPLPAQTVEIEVNQVKIITEIYAHTEQTLGGTLPQPLGFTEAATTLPFALVGQLSSGLGTGSGTVISKRVVLTAAHVVFDSDTLSYASDLRWQFRRFAGQLEPVPLAPRGTFALDGYAQVAHQQGDASAEEQDSAVVFFNEDPGEGGFTGYLVNNEEKNWLMENRLTILAGYPVDTNLPSGTVVPGRLQATPQRTASFASGGLNAPDDYITTDLAGLSGMSGGPLFVQGDDGKFYPAGVYLGGDNDCRVRAITDDVELLIENAELMSDGGSNHVGGGIVKVDSIVADPLGRGTFILSLDGAPAAASWTLVGGKIRHTKANPKAEEPTGRVVFGNVPEYGKPDDFTFSVASGLTENRTATYNPLPPAIHQTPLRGAAGLPFAQKIKADNATSFTGELLDAAGHAGPLTNNGNALQLVLDSKGNLTCVSPPDNTLPGTSKGNYRLRIRAANRFFPNLASNTPTLLSLTIVDAHEVTVSFDPKLGKIVSNPPLLATGKTQKLAEGTPISLIAFPGIKSYFLGWSGVGGPVIKTPPIRQNLAFTLGKQNVQLQARFQENIIYDQAGKYQGLLTAGADSLNSRGLITAQLTKLGGCTISFTTGTTTRKLVSRIQDIDDATKKATLVQTVTDKKTKANDYTISLQLAVGTGSAPARLNGNIKVGNSVYEFDMTRAVTSSVAGSYLVALPHSADPALPQGDGYGTATLSNKGTVKFVGKLGDGTTVSQASSLDKDLNWPFFSLIALTKNPRDRAGLVGVLAINLANSAAGPISGQLDWYRPAAETAFFPDGFVSSNGRQNGLALLSAAVPTDKFVTLTGATISVQGGGTAQTPLTIPVTFNKGSADKVDPVNPAGLFRFKLGLTSGQFTGMFSYLKPNATKPTLRSFSGVVLPVQGQLKAYGVLNGDPAPDGDGQTGSLEF